jgi:hypothetical protein
LQARQELDTRAKEIQALQAQKVIMVMMMIIIMIMIMIIIIIIMIVMIRMMVGLITVVMTFMKVGVKKWLCPVPSDLSFLLFALSLGDDW